MLKPTCATKYSILHTSILKSSAMTACSTLFYLCYQAWCSSAPLEAHLCRRAALPRVRRSTAMTYLTVGTQGGIYTSFLPSQLSSPRLALQTNTFWLSSCFLSPPLVPKSSQSFRCDFPINPWEKKVPNLIREQMSTKSGRQSTEGYTHGSRWISGGARDMNQMVTETQDTKFI